MTESRGRYHRHDRERAAEFWRGYLWGHMDGAGELVVELFDRLGGMSPELYAATRVLAARRAEIAAAKGVLSLAQQEQVYRLLTDDREGA